MIVRILAILCLLVVAPNALAWGKFGHVTICEIAYREMTPDARTELNRILVAHGEYTSFNRACLEADRFPRTLPAAHFVNYPRELDEVTDDSCNGASRCVISEIDSDFQKLANTSLTDQERGEAMILMGHWVGDIHQPLHVSYKDDRGGNSIKKRGKCSASNLHAVWDNCIVEDKVLLGNALQRLFGWAKFTRAYRAADRLGALITDQQRANWTNSEVFEWAAESYEITTQPDVGYCHLRSGACWYDTQNKVFEDGEEQKVFQNNAAYHDQFGPVVEERIMKAGVRLGDLLNQALDP